MDSIFETLVAKISAANELFKTDNPSIHQTFYQQDKVPENSKVYHNNYNEYKSKRLSERELKRPWSKLSTNYKILVILDFLREFEKRHPNVNLNLIRYDTLLNVENNKGLDLKMDYDYQIGKLKKIYGYNLVEDKVIKSDNTDDCISNRSLLILRYKSGYRPPNSEDHIKIIEDLSRPKTMIGFTAILNKR